MFSKCLLIQFGLRHDRSAKVMRECDAFPRVLPAPLNVTGVNIEDAVVDYPGGFSFDFLCTYLITAFCCSYRFSTRKVGLSHKRNAGFERSEMAKRKRKFPQFV